MSMLFLMHARIKYRYLFINPIFKFVKFLMNTVWFFSFLISTTVAFLPIIPSSLFAPVIAYLPISMTLIGIITSIVAILLYIIYALVGLLSIIKNENWETRGKYQQTVLFIFSLALPVAFAFSLSKVLKLEMITVLMLTATFTYISYLVSGVRFEPFIEESEYESMFHTLGKFGGFESIHVNDMPRVIEAYDGRRNKIKAINKEIEAKNDKTLQKAIVLINILYAIYIILAIAAIVILVVSTKRNELGKIWASFLIYAPALFTVLKIISSVIDLIKKKSKKAS